ncbi:MAG: alpha/beta fold hydrolase [Candidatus Kerfeldbacteria bacterium]|nr:alpha/beta fold hydrolase [Candidatus Kerfeldbacteria bacterium]
MASTLESPAPLQHHGDDTGILLVHGFSGSPASFAPLIPRLIAQGWTVHTIWLAGHGTSEEDLATKTSSDWVLSLRAGIDRLRRQTQRIIVIGDSFGGNLALYAALMGPPIAGVVTLGTPVSARHDLMNRALLPILTRIQPYHRKSWVKDPAAQRAAGSYLRIPLRAYAEVIRFIDRHTKRELEGVRVPLFVVQAKKDYEVHPSSAYFLSEHAGSTHKALLWVDERIHHVLLSKEADRIIDRIIGFVQAIAKQA